jgi:hypothetical protein
MYTPSPVGNGSMVSNGQIIGVPMMNQFFPDLASAPFYKGSGQPPPTVPLNYMQGSGAQNDALAATAAANPFSFTQSPLIIALVALVGGVLWLRFIHWRH